jgi:alpha-beta hydrolase superfamily lysophospholipase
VSHDSILLTHGAPTERVFVLLHGLTATPRQFEPFGRLLFETGNVFIPRLPRHGLADRLTTVLRYLTADELREFASAAVAQARTLGREVVVVGFSVGGLLSAWIAQHHAVTRSVSIAPFLGVAWLPSQFTPRAARFLLRAPNRFYWWDPRLRERLGPEHGYPRFATHAVAQAATLAAELLRDAKRHAPQTRDAPIVLNESEITVSNAAARRLAKLWARRAGSPAAIHSLRGLPLSHDIIEPLREPNLTPLVYPELLALVRG